MEKLEIKENCLILEGLEEVCKITPILGLETEALKRRIKASWNATLGYSTPHLEEVGDLKTVSDEQKRQLEELKTALNHATIRLGEQRKEIIELRAMLEPERSGQ